MTRNAIYFRVTGTPKAQPRPRAFARKMGAKHVARVYDDSTAEGWKALVAMAALDHLPAEPITGPVRLDLTFVFARPKRLQRKRDQVSRIPHDSKPDRDNLEKAVLDALTQLGMWADDCQVCAGEVRKFYVEKDGGDLPGCEVRLVPLGDYVAAVDAGRVSA